MDEPLLSAGVVVRVTYWDPFMEFDDGSEDSPGVLGIQLPAFQAQTPWMAKKSLVSEVAGVIVDIGLQPKGLAPVTRIEVVSTYDPRENDWPVGGAS